VPICPECHASYEDGVILCRNCRAALVETLPPGEPEDLFVDLKDVPDPVTAAMWQGALESQGIHAVVHSNALPAYGDVLRDWSTQAWGTLRVPRAEYDEATAVLEDFLATAATKAPEEDEPQDEEAPPS
jgi:hypothetical protein